MLKINKFDRNLAVNYALQYALVKNPQYHDYTNLGGNCTNFISQCIFAGAPQMNTSNNGWYYYSVSNTTPAWANVEPFYNFATTNNKLGFFAKNTNINLCEVGDIIQLRFKNKTLFSHSLIITKIMDYSPKGILVCANSNDVKNKPLADYLYAELRILHILAYRTAI